MFGPKDLINFASASRERKDRNLRTSGLHAKFLIASQEFYDKFG